MKSLDYIKQRIKEGTTDLSDCDYETMVEVNTVDIFEKMYESRGLETGITVGTKDNEVANIYYNPNAEFNYFTMSRNVNDGTLIFDFETMQDVLCKVLSCSTYNKAVLPEIPNDEEYFNKHYFQYTVGDIVLCQEYDSNKFSTNEKSWFTRRTTALLPIKFEVLENK
jgi:hypothetical protein